MNSNRKSSVSLNFSAQQERAIQALHECVFHMKFRLKIVHQYQYMYQPLWQALVGCPSHSKVSRLRGDYEWSARQPNHLRLPGRLHHTPNFHHGFLLAPIVIQFHWVQYNALVLPQDIAQRHIPFLFQATLQDVHRYITEKIVAIAGCFCQLPCEGECHSWEWIPLDLLTRNILQSPSGLYAPCLECCLVPNDRFFNIITRMSLLQTISNLTVFPRDCFYMSHIEETDDDILDLAYDVNAACRAVTPELSACVSWMVFSDNTPLTV
jgi:hypothetical protein